MLLKWRWAPVIALVVVMLSLERAATADLFDEIYARGRPIEASLKTLTAHLSKSRHHRCSRDRSSRAARSPSFVLTGS